MSATIRSPCASAISQTLDRVRRKRRLAFDTRQAFDREEIDLYWQLAWRVVSTLHRMKGTTRALPFVEDLAVPPAALPDFLVRMQNTLKRHQVTASLFGHVGHGQLHVRPFLDLTIADDVRKMEDLAADLYREVFEVRGHDQRRAWRRTQPHAVYPPAIRRTV